MRTRLVAGVVSLGAMMALPAWGQRGGSHGGGSGGRSGGPVGHSAAAFHGGPSFAGHAGFMGSPQLSVSRSANAGAYSRLMNRSAQGGYGFRAGTGRPDRYRRPYAPVYGFGLPYSVGWIGPDYLDSLDSYDPGFYGSAFPGAAQDAGAYAVPGPGLDPGAAPVEEADAGPATMYRPAYQRPEPAPDPGTEAAVTLVFKDGRPNEQIHNYMLTRSTLYVQEQRMRQIPVADLDLDATQRVNKEAGVDFQLPAGAR